jgi:hypothetical protein
LIGRSSTLVTISAQQARFAIGQLLFNQEPQLIRVVDLQIIESSGEEE